MVKRVGICFFVLLLIFNGYEFCKAKSNVDNTAELRQVVSVLQENGYREGYSTFWRSNILTELSNGSIDVRSWQDSTGESLWVTNINSTMGFLHLKAHNYFPPSGKVFMLFTVGEW